MNCNYLEAKNLESRWQKEGNKLERQLRAVRYKHKVVKRVIETNDNGEKNWIVEMPIDALAERKKDINESLNWKKLVLEMFEIHKIPMTSELVYRKLLLHEDKVPLDRKFAIRNISAALHYLEAKDSKLFRMKNPDGKGFIYGLKHFFDFSFRLKPEFLKAFKMEIGVVSTERI